MLSCTKRELPGAIINPNGTMDTVTSGGVIGGGGIVEGDDGTTTDISTYLSALSQRSDYLGQIKGMFR